jgi:hypothetical protein
VTPKILRCSLLIDSVPPRRLPLSLS